MSGSTKWSTSHKHLFFFLLSCALFPIGPLCYAIGVAIYYGGGWAGKRAQESGLPYFITPPRLLASVVFNVPLLFAGFADTPDDPEISRAVFIVAAVFVFAVSVISTLALLWCCVVPLYLLGWIGKGTRIKGPAARADDRRLAREAEERAMWLQQQEIQRRQQQAAVKSEQQRRTEARAQCELHYALHVAEVADRFPRSMLDDFMTTYMGDDQDADTVERRGAELRGIIQQHKRAVKPEAKPRTIAELSHWYLEEKTKIEALEIEERIKKAHLVQLNMRYSELTQDLLQKIEP